MAACGFLAGRGFLGGSGFLAGATFLAGAFFATVFLAGTFLVGDFFAGDFFATDFFALAAGAGLDFLVKRETALDNFFFSGTTAKASRGAQFIRTIDVLDFTSLTATR